MEANSQAPFLERIYTSRKTGKTFKLYQYQAVPVLDGGTIEVMHNGKAQRISLQGINCPEKGQPFGNSAKQATSDLVFARSVMVERHGQGQYKGALAMYFLQRHAHHSRIRGGGLVLVVSDVCGRR